ncbi:hypothetical protein AURDEDRAFT_160765 [Auricularia subglabra TFB-10046 SS5]|nr:hypothetical protein AURDEDRAFT_160765 [Auricularia subglabra TFB-10046 SS5]
MLTQRRNAAVSPGITVVRPAVDHTARLPLEILVNIFSYFRPREYSELVCVCHRWYNTVRGTPTLWASIDEEDHTVSSRYLETVLTNSVDTPLSIRMSIPQPVTGVDGVQRPASVYFDILGPHLGRIERLQLQLAAREDAQALLELLRNGGGSLRVLRLLPVGESDTRELVLADDLLARNRGVLEDITIAWNLNMSTAMPAAFRNVTHFQWFSDRVAKETLAAVFYSCVSLVSLEVKAQEYHDNYATSLVHNLREVVIYQPVKHALLADLSHETIPVVGFSTDRKAALHELQWAERSDNDHSSWPPISAHRFDALTMVWDCAGIPVLSVQYTTGNICRFAHISSIMAMDVLSGLNGHGLDFGHLTSLTIEDGCWPERVPLAPALSTLTIVLTRPPSEAVTAPTSIGRWTIFGDNCESVARLTLPNFPVLETLYIAKARSCSRDIDLPAQRLLAFFDAPRAGRAMHRLQLSPGIRHHWTYAERDAVLRCFGTVVA